MIKVAGDEGKTSSVSFGTPQAQAPTHVHICAHTGKHT